MVEIKLKNGKPNILLLTFPRTGQHLLRSILQSADIELDWTHNIDLPQFIWKADEARPFFDGSQTLITLVRDPIDTITSALVYDMYQNNYTLKNIKMFSGVIVDDYVVFWKYLLENCKIFIDYDDLINNRDKTVDHLFNLLNIKKERDFGNIIQAYEPNHMVSSKDNHLYDKVKSEVLAMNLNKCYDIYQECKNKTIKVDK